MSTHKQLISLTSETVSKLSNLSDNVQYSSKIEHLGVNGCDRPSVYISSKWYDWTRQQKQEFKICFDSAYTDAALIGWFLKYPKDTGFLDRTEYWKNTNSAGIVLAYALNDGQDIHLDDVKVPVLKGQGIAFSLRIPHEVKAKNTEQRWACLMTLSVPK